jgi:hypothetical protein
MPKHQPTRLLGKHHALFTERHVHELGTGSKGGSIPSSNCSRIAMRVTKASDKRVAAVEKKQAWYS